MNNTIDEIKGMLDKLSEELESLRAENQELKLRLAKYEPADSQELLGMSVDKLEVSDRVKNCMHRAGIHTVGDIIVRDTEKLISANMIGFKTADEIVDEMERLGFKTYAEKTRQELYEIKQRKGKK